MACKYLKYLNVNGQMVECQATNTNECPKSRGFFRVSATCWRFKEDQNTFGMPDSMITEMGANHSVDEILHALFKRTNGVSVHDDIDEEYVIECLRRACFIPHTQDSINRQRVKNTHQISKNDTRLSKTSNNSTYGERIKRTIEKPLHNQKTRVKAIRARDGNKCQICGKTGKGLHVHHISPPKSMHHQKKKGRKDHRPSNLITLCEDCHKNIHTFDRAIRRLNKNRITPPT